nr:uncharacterized protein LOC109175935 [Ipomoea batatas]
MNSITAAMALLSPSISSIAFDNRPSPCPAPTSRRGGGRKLLVLSSFTTNTALFNPLSSASVAPTTAGAATLSIVKRKVACQAVGESSPPPSDSTVVYQGIYGPWTVEDSDVREVILYRSGLVTAAVSFVLASSAVLLPDDSVLRDLIKSNVDILYMLGACGLGLSLYLIHIYVTEIKRTLQAFWAIGVFGSLATYAALAQPAGSSLVQYVVEKSDSCLVCWPTLCCTDRARLQGRPLLWEVGSWNSHICHPISSSRTPDWVDGRRSKSYPTERLDGTFSGVCRKKVHTANKG